MCIYIHREIHMYDVSIVTVYSCLIIAIYPFLTGFLILAVHCMKGTGMVNCNINSFLNMDVPRWIIQVIGIIGLSAGCIGPYVTIHQELSILIGLIKDNGVK